jgi:hypothetical protein
MMITHHHHDGDGRRRDLPRGSARPGRALLSEAGDMEEEDDDDGFDPEHDPGDEQDPG